MSKNLNDLLNIVESLKKPISAFDFARLAFAALDHLHTQEFELRRDAWVKRLVEEIVPIAVFAKCLEGPERHLTLTYVGDEKKFDGEMLITGATVEDGFLEPKYYLEVTSAVAPYEHLQRESLARYGSVFGGPNIWTTGSKARGNREVISTPSVRDIGADLEDAKTWVRQAISEKSQGVYPEPCLLLVRTEPESNLSLSSWASLAVSVREVSVTSKFKAIYLVHTSSGAVHKV